MATSKIVSTAVERSTLQGQQTSPQSGEFKVLLLSAAVAGLVGMSGTASAQLFTATATVQNAVTITQTTPLNFGTVFATKTILGSSAADKTYSRRLTLAPAGTIAQGTGALSTAPALLALSGATAGAYSAPSLPSNASVNVLVKTAAGNSFVNTNVANDVVCKYASAAAAITANQIVLQNGADPTTAFFCVNSFTSDRTNLVLDDVNTSGSYALGFGITTLTFNLGATLIAQAPDTAVQRTFAAGAYTGSFNMEVTFP